MKARINQIWFLSQRVNIIPFALEFKKDRFRICILSFVFTVTWGGKNEQQIKRG